MDAKSTEGKPGNRRAAWKVRTWRIPPWALQLLELVARVVVGQLG